LKIYNGTDLTISGEDLDHMNAADLDNAISKATIFYRVSPKHKLIIVKVTLLFIINQFKIFPLGFTSSGTYCWYDR
jgi:hypothetical protein